MSLIDGLKAFYKSENNAIDSVNGFNGTDYNITYNLDYGKILQGAKFNGSNGYENLPTTILDTSQSYTVSVWVNIQVLPTVNYGALILGKYQDSPAWNYGFFNLGVSSEGTKNIFVSNRDSSGVIVNQNLVTSPTTDHWYHIVCVYDRSAGTCGTNYFYVDNVLVATVANSRFYGNNSNPIRAGKSQDNWQGAYLNGYQDERGFWSRALSSDEVSELWNNGNGVSYPFSNFFISGVVKNGESLVSGAIVRIIDQETNDTLEEVETGENGEFLFNNLNENHKFHLAVEYKNENDELFNAKSLWDIVPVEET